MSVRTKQAQGRPRRSTGVRAATLERTVEALVAAGEVQEANELVYRQHAPTITRWIMRRIWSPVLVEDLVQDVFVQLAARLEDMVRGGLLRKTWGGWLQTVARRRLADHFRRLDAAERAQCALELKTESAEVPRPDTRLVEDASCVEVHLACALLQTGERAIVEMRYFLELSWEETGVRLGKSATAVRMEFDRFKDRLRRYLGWFGITTRIA